MAQYLKLPAIVVAIIACAIALTIALLEKQTLELRNLVKQGGAVLAVSEEEDFLNE